MKKILSLMIISTFFMASVFADENEGVIARKVTGIVLDEQNKPLPGASVVAVGTTIGAGTNAKGEFSINLKEGNYTIRISFTGYESQEYGVNTSDVNKIVAILKPAENGLNEVVVTGTRTEKPLKDVPVLTRVITQEDIVRLNPIDIKTVLEYEIPGLQFGRHHGTGLPTIVFQGAAGKNLLILLDGERISGEGANDEVDFNRININDVERVEIIKGAASTMYGSNALGGVVNIITKSANRPVIANVTGRYSNRDEQSYSVNGGTRQNRLSWLSDLSYRKKDAYSVTDDVEGGSDYNVQGYETWQTSHKVGYAFTEQFSAEVKGSFYNNRRINYSESATSQNIFKDYTGNAKLKYLINSNNKLDLTYNYDTYMKYNDVFETGIKTKTYADDQHTVRLNYTGNYGERHTFTAGAEADIQSLKHYMFKDTTSNDIKMYTLYAQEDWRITNSLSVVAGIRADYHSEYHLHFTPKISAMYKLYDFTFRAGYGAGYRSPSLKELYAEWNHSGMFMMYGNPDLKPEKSNQTSVSAEYTKGIFNASASWYYNNYRNRISSARVANDDGSYYYQYLNVSKARVTGVDVTAQLRFKWGLNIRAAYAYVDDHNETDGKNLSSSTAPRPHSVTFNINYNHKFGKVDSYVAFNGRWMDSVTTYSSASSTTPVKHDGRTICSMYVGAKFPRGIGANIGFDNILNFKDKKISSDSTIAPEQGIGFVASLSINIADLFKL